jgi:hypothetical protein
MVADKMVACMDVFPEGRDTIFRGLKGSLRDAKRLEQAFRVVGRKKILIEVKELRRVRYEPEKSVYF